MKCVAYISKAPFTKSGICLPIGLSDIVKASHRNHKSKMTGFLCYRQGYYFQVIEGPYREVDNLVSKIAADSRHSDCFVFIDKRIDRRCFQEWKVSVFDLVDQSQMFKKFFKAYKIETANFTEQQKLGLQKFYNLRNLSYSENYEGKNLRLIAWPDLNHIDQSQTVINLCIKLTKKPYSFNELVDNQQFGTRDQVVEALNQFQNLGILTMTGLETLKKNETEIVHAKGSSSFFGAIKKFLGMR